MLNNPQWYTTHFIHHTRVYDRTHEDGDLSYVDQQFERIQFLWLPVSARQDLDVVVSAEIVACINGNPSPNMPAAWQQWLTVRFLPDSTRTLNAQHAMDILITQRAWETWRPKFLGIDIYWNEQVRITLQDLSRRL